MASCGNGNGKGGKEWKMEVLFIPLRPDVRIIRRIEWAPSARTSLRVENGSFRRSRTRQREGEGRKVQSNSRTQTKQSSHRVIKL